jgi:hypothetical protein
MPPHPGCLGVYGSDGTVEDYLESQEVRPYFHYDDVYTAVYKRMVAKLDSMAENLQLQKKGRRKKETKILNPGFSELLVSSWLDIDATTGAYCEQRRLKKPTDLAELVGVHIRAIKAWLAGLSLA